jgi:hypothetical protein
VARRVSSRSGTWAGCTLLRPRVYASTQLRRKRIPRHHARGPACAPSRAGCAKAMNAPGWWESITRDFGPTRIPVPGLLRPDAETALFRDAVRTSPGVLQRPAGRPQPGRAVAARSVRIPGLVQRDAPTALFRPSIRTSPGPPRTAWRPSWPQVRPAGGPGRISSIRIQSIRILSIRTAQSGSRIR